MEAALLVLLFIGGAVLAFGGKRRSAKHTPPAKKSYPKKHQKPPQPFDAKSAHKQPTCPPLQGAAYVIDGDTVVIQKTQIRLFGVDAPEMNQPSWKEC